MGTDSVINLISAIFGNRGMKLLMSHVIEIRSIRTLSHPTESS